MSMDYKISLKKRAGVLAASVGKEIISPTGRFGNTAFHTSNLSNVTIDLNRTTMTKNTTLEIFTETNERMENYVKTVGLMKGKVRARHIHTFGNFHQNQINFYDKLRSI